MKSKTKTKPKTEAAKPIDLYDKKTFSLSEANDIFKGSLERRGDEFTSAQVSAFIQIMGRVHGTAKDSIWTERDVRREASSMDDILTPNVIDAMLASYVATFRSLGKLKEIPSIPFEPKIFVLY